MTPTIDPKEQAFVHHALASVDRAQRWAKVRFIAATCAAALAAVWFASRSAARSGPSAEAPILIITGAMIGLATVKLRWLILQNTRLVLQAIASLQSPADARISPSRGSERS